MTSNGFFNFIIITAITLTSASPSFAEDIKKTAEVVETDILYLCKRNKNTRWLRAYKLENGKCNTLYSKEGYLQVIGSAVYFSSCEGVLHSVKKNLEEGGFKCSPITKYAVLDLE